MNFSSTCLVNMKAFMMNVADKGNSNLLLRENNGQLSIKTRYEYELSTAAEIKSCELVEKGLAT